MIPVVLAHVRLSSAAPIEELETLRDAIRLVIEAHADRYGVRVKRRQITGAQFHQLFETYQRRANLPARPAVTVTVKTGAPKRATE